MIAQISLFQYYVASFLVVMYAEMSSQQESYRACWGQESARVIQMTHTEDKRRKTQRANKLSSASSIFLLIQVSFTHDARCSLWRHDYDVSNGLVNMDLTLLTAHQYARHKATNILTETVLNIVIIHVPLMTDRFFWGDQYVQPVWIIILFDC